MTNLSPLKLALMASLLLLCAGMTGCGDASASPSSAPISIDQARTLLTSVLEAWKSGQTYTGRLESGPSVRVADEDWLATTRLVDFELGNATTVHLVGVSRRWPVVLKLRTPRGQTVKRSVVYEVVGEPQASVVRQD
jgi:hypothetical protein